MGKSVTQVFLVNIRTGKIGKCWRWKGPKGAKGYGVFVVDRHKFSAHRFSYELYNGLIPDGCTVCHACGNKACVNPAHLFLKDGKQTLAQKFWPKVDVQGVNECWEWLAAKYSNGYGTIGGEPKSFLAHRVSYELNIGPIPDGLLVCHRCDNPSCVNPAHLFLGTAKDNAQDMVQKGRARGKPAFAGELNVKAKLSWDEVRAIRLAATNGVSNSVLARGYQVSRSTISRIIRNDGWME